MLESEGYKMFRGTVTVDYGNGHQPFKEYGDWLYKPDKDTWYCNCKSFEPEFMFDFVEEVG